MVRGILRVAYCLSKLAAAFVASLEFRDVRAFPAQLAMFCLHRFARS